MTDEEWTERLRAFDRCREEHARTLATFRAQVEAARQTLSHVLGRLEAERPEHREPGERRPRLKRRWSTRAPRPVSRKHSPSKARLREFTADGKRWSVWETTPTEVGAVRGGGGRQGRSTGEVDRGGRQGRSTGEVDRGGRQGRQPAG